MPDDIESLYEEALSALYDDDLDEAVEAMNQMIDVAPDDPHTMEVQGDVTRELEDYSAAEAHYRRLMDVPDEHWKGVGNVSLSALFAVTDRIDKVRGHLTAAVEHFLKASSISDAVQAYVSIASFDQNVGEFETSAEALRSAQALISASDDPEEFDSVTGNVLQMLGTCYRLQGKLDIARETLNQSLKLFQKTEEPDEAANTLDAIGVIEQIQGDYDAAEERHLKAVEINEAIDSAEGLSVNFGNLTMLNINRRNFGEAAKWAEKAFEIDEALDDENGVAHYHLLMGEIEAERGNFSKAEDHLKTCSELYDECGDAEDQLCADGKFAVLYHLQGRFDEAAEINERTLARAQQMGHADGIAATLEYQGHVRQSQGRIDDARKCWEQALAAYEELQSVQMIAEVKGHLAELN